MTPAEIQERLHAVIDDARAIDTRPYEQSEYDALLQELLPATEKALTVGIQTISLVFERYEAGDEASRDAEATPARPATDESFGGGIDRVMKTERAAQRIADLCFMARLELRAKQEQLVTLKSLNDSWRAISVCASVRRKLIKSVAAIERALCEHEGLQTRVAGAYETEVQRALAVRRAYTLFRHAVVLTETPATLDVIRLRLRHAGIHIAKLVGRDVYEDLRIDDRMQLRRLQEQLVAWLRGGDGFVPRMGLRLLQDLSAFAGILVLVNNRTTLREHDTATVVELLASLARLPPEAALSEAASSRVQTLYGRDDELDRLIESRTALNVETCRAHLARIQAALIPSAGSGASMSDALPPGDPSPVANLPQSGPPRASEHGVVS